MERAMNQQVKGRRLLEWLTFTPTLDKVARALVLDYFLPFEPVESAIWHLSDRDALTCLAIYGPSDAIVGVAIPGNTWRNSSEYHLLASQSEAKKRASWSASGCDVVANLYGQGRLIGFLTIRFPKKLDNANLVTTDLEVFSMLISLYLSIRFGESIPQNGRTNHTRNGQNHNGRPELTERQRIVLAGIVMKKTNNAIASELGYSVSTIRHETMRIFDILDVSNRVEAAVHATTLGLI